jgi:uncharacterized protein YbbK (DUF523 family)
MKVLVSACLLGENCKYNGGNNLNPRVLAFLEGKEVIPVCPEMLAGLGTPRAPVEIVEGVVKTRDGVSFDEPLRQTVQQIVDTLDPDIQCAVLQSRSPTCGVNQIYDGTFSGRRITGSGVLAQALRDAGIRLIDAEDLP